MALRPPLDDLYGELGVAPDATRGEILAAYRARVKELHPDTRPADADAVERFRRVGAAYRILVDPDARASYDAASTAAALAAPVAPPPRPPTVSTAPAPARPRRVSKRAARWCAWGGVALSIFGVVVGAFVFSLQRHDADLRANGVAATAVVIPGPNGQRLLEFETTSGRVVRAQESVKTGEEQPLLGSRVRVHYDRSDPTSIVTDQSHTGRDVTLWIVAVKLLVGGGVLTWFGMRMLRRSRGIAPAL